MPPYLRCLLADVLQLSWNEVHGLGLELLHLRFAAPLVAQGPVQLRPQLRALGLELARLVLHCGQGLGGPGGLAAV